MSRRKKKPHGRPSHKPALTEAQKDEQVVRETAAIFTCSSQMTHEFVHQCDDNMDNLVCDLDYTRLALQMWRGRGGHVDMVTAVLADLLAARERHRAEIAQFRQRLTDLMAVPHDEHLQPVEDWLPLVRKHIIDGTVD